jgi:type IV pilus assembly protein PilW
MHNSISRKPGFCGFTLIELLIALVIGSIAILAATQLLAAVNRLLQTRDAVAEMRERARFVLATIEPDLQMAGYFGLTSHGADFFWMVGGNATTAAGPALLAQSAPVLTTVPSGAQACGNNFALDLAHPVQGDNNSFMLSASRTGSCSATGGAQANSDTLTIRRAATTIAAPAAGRIQLLVDRSDERRRWIMADGVVPAGVTAIPDQMEWHDLEVRSYYISKSSVGMPGVPALRVKSLSAIAGRPAFIDTEVMPGVEDLQIQFQTDRGVFNPDAAAAGNSIKLVQLWLRLRSLNRETSFVDAHHYDYADVSMTPAPAEQSYRRLLVTRSVAVRNAALN